MTPRPRFPKAEPGAPSASHDLSRNLNQSPRMGFRASRRKGKVETFFRLRLFLFLLEGFPAEAEGVGRLVVFALGHELGAAIVEAKYFIVQV